MKTMDFMKAKWMNLKNRRLTAWTVLLGIALTILGNLHGAEPPGKAISYKKVSKASSKLRVHFIDLGPGDAILIETPIPGGKHIFLDGGKLGTASILKPYLRYFVGTNKIDLAIVTHPDYDHIKGMDLVFKEFSVLEYWDTGYESPQLGSAWRALQERIGDEPGCDSFTPIGRHYNPGDKVILDQGQSADESDDIYLQFIHVDGNPPYRDPRSGRRFSESERRNNASLVVKLVYGKVNFLLAGDINGRKKEHIGAGYDAECDSVEKALLELHAQPSASTSGFLAATVLKAAHHGSNGASSLDFIHAVAPTWVVFSAGHEFDHPHPDTLRRFHAAGFNDAHLLRTDEGDSTPETKTVSDKIGDDCFIFEVDGESVSKVQRVYIGS